mgnify:CR=1 FL=1
MRQTGRTRGQIERGRESISSHGDVVRAGTYLKADRCTWKKEPRLELPLYGIADRPAPYPSPAASL